MKASLERGIGVVIHQLARIHEYSVLDYERDLIAALRKPKPRLFRIIDKVKPSKPAVNPLAGCLVCMIVKPKRTSPLLIGVDVSPRTPGTDAIVRMTIMLRSNERAVQMH